MDYRPQEIAVRKGRLRKARLAILGSFCALLIGGVITCFAIPQAKMDTFTVKNDLYGLSPVENSVEGRPITRRMILDGMGLSGSELSMFMPAKRLERNLSEAWFVSERAAVDVELGPFSATVSFQDVYPLGVTTEGEVYLSNGQSYSGFASQHEEIKDAYPTSDLESLVTVPIGEMSLADEITGAEIVRFDYGDEETLSNLLVDLACIDPEILASGYLVAARSGETEGDIYLYFDFSETEAHNPVNTCVLIPRGLLPYFSGREMVSSLSSTMRNQVAENEVVHEGHPFSYDGDLFTQKEWYHLRFEPLDSGRFGIFWEQAPGYDQNSLSVAAELTL